LDRISLLVERWGWPLSIDCSDKANPLPSNLEKHLRSLIALLNEGYPSAGHWRQLHGSNADPIDFYGKDILPSIN
jgi:hypothetical protein